MKRKIPLAPLLAGMVFALALCACSAAREPQPSARPAETSPAEPAPTPGDSAGVAQAPSSVLERDPSETLTISLGIGGQSFTAELENNETAQAFADLLPLTLDMSELNGNEKFYYMDASLPTNAANPGRINAGDLMLYGDNCLVLFFDSFSTAYSYTRLGHVDDAKGLVNTLDSGTVTILFSRSE